MFTCYGLIFRKEVAPSNSITSTTNSYIVVFSRGCLYDDVLENLSEVRRHAMENMRKLREKSGTLKGKPYGF